MKLGSNKYLSVNRANKFLNLYCILYIFQNIYRINMGLFGKKEKKSEFEKDIPSLPSLPRLPELPYLESENKSMDRREVNQLPSFPSNSIGKRFSRDSIKDAVSGGRGEEDFYADDFSDDDDEMRRMQGPLRRPLTEEIEEDEIRERMPGRDRISRRDMGMKRTTDMDRMGGEMEMGMRELEPMFVRIDKFEEGLKLLESIKGQISDIESILAETKRLKEKEEAELHSWENELKRMKMELEKMGRDIFSKI